MLKSVFLLALAGLSYASPLVSVGQIPFNAETNGTDSKVNVTLYVMSRCPDAVRSFRLPERGLISASL